MTLRNKLLLDLLAKAKENGLSKDNYSRLVDFEQMIVDVIKSEVLTPHELMTARRLLAGVNKIQICLLEIELGEDIDGDGKIGRGGN